MDKDTPEERQGKSIQHSKQLDEVVSGKQKLNKLSNPYRPVAQHYVEQLTKSLPLAQRQVFQSYLRLYLDRIPFYLETKGNNDKSTTTTTKEAGTTTATTKSQKQPRNELVSLLSPSKTHSKKQRLLVPTKKSQFTRSGVVITSRRTAATTTNRRLRTAMKEEIKMKLGGFTVNGRPYQFFSKERAILNRLLKGNGITRRGGVWNFFQSSNKGGRRMGKAKRYSRGSWRKKGGRHHNKWVKYLPKWRKK